MATSITDSASSSSLAVNAATWRPSEEKTALVLALKGGRQQRRRCVHCGGAGTRLDVHVDGEALTVGGQAEGDSVRIFWTCSGCHVQLREGRE